ncbi:MAG: hypothetical protein HQM16_06125 [Deltaproteobacteria bacterium]|nr:hypothetical protein [Deltaproteobacteria bacterium]
MLRPNLFSYVSGLKLAELGEISAAGTLAALNQNAVINCARPPHRDTPDIQNIKPPIATGVFAPRHRAVRVAHEMSVDGSVVPIIEGGWTCAGAGTKPPVSSLGDGANHVAQRPPSRAKKLCEDLVRDIPLDQDAWPKMPDEDRRRELAITISNYLRRHGVIDDQDRVAPKHVFGNPLQTDGDGKIWWRADLKTVQENIAHALSQTMSFEDIEDGDIHVDGRIQGYKRDILERDGAIRGMREVFGKYDLGDLRTRDIRRMNPDQVYKFRKATGVYDTEAFAKQIERKQRDKAEYRICLRMAVNFLRTLVELQGRDVSGLFKVLPAGQKALIIDFPPEGIPDERQSDVIIADHHGEGKEGLTATSEVWRLRQEGALKGVVRVIGNHWDTDRVMAEAIGREYIREETLAQKAIAAAQAGDYLLGDEEAVIINQIILAMIYGDQGPSPKFAAVDKKKIIELVPDILAHPKKYEKYSRGTTAFIEASSRAIDQGRLTIDGGIALIETATYAHPIAAYRAIAGHPEIEVVVKRTPAKGGGWQYDISFPPEKTLKPRLSLARAFEMLKNAEAESSNPGFNPSDNWGCDPKRAGGSPRGYGSQLSMEQVRAILYQALFAAQ